MHRRVFLLLIGFAFTLPLVARSEGQPFAGLPTEDAPKFTGWGWNNRDKAKYFNAERKRLGESFQRELLKYVGENVQRHYWCAAFLTTYSDIGTTPPMPELALLLLEQGITLCRASLSHSRNKEDLVTLSVSAALLSQQLGLSVQAKHHRARAEHLVEEDPHLAGAWPVQSQANRKIFNSIPYEPKVKTQ